MGWYKTHRVVVAVGLKNKQRSDQDKLTLSDSMAMLSEAHLNCEICIWFTSSMNFDNSFLQAAAAAAAAVAEALTSEIPILPIRDLI